MHLLTASSAPAGLLAILATIRGDIAAAFLWMAYTLAVDSIDGTLARAVRVKDVVPSVDGSRLDDVVDYFTYVVVPAFFMVHTGLLGAAAVPVASLVLVASGYGFSQTAAKTPDHFFSGFPSYWNVVTFYLLVAGWPSEVNAAILIAFAVMVFVPIRYVYPSRTPAWSLVTNLVGAVWAGLMLLMLWQYPAVSAVVFWVSLAYPAYYFLLSFGLHFRLISSAT